LKNLRLPAPTEVKCYSVKGIIQSRGKLSTIEKLNLLLTLQEALHAKLDKCDKKREQKKAEKEQGVAQVEALIVKQSK
jgi:hypothetical protein